MTDKILSETSLVRYDAMLLAIEQCHKIDEIKELHNKALALELYAKVAMNTDAERKAVEIRVRAERRAGELLKEMQRRPGARTDQPGSLTGRGSEYRNALKSSGINKKAAHRWQQLAAIPKNDFERALGDSERKPSTQGILSTFRTVSGGKRVSEDSLWVWGRIIDFERTLKKIRPHSAILDDMTIPMYNDIGRLLPMMIEWLTELRRNYESRARNNNAASGSSHSKSIRSA